MDGSLNGSSPDRPPAVWLCASTDVTATEAPGWMTADEFQRLAQLAGASRCDFLASRWLIRHGLAVASGGKARHCWPADGRPDNSAEPPGWRLSLSHSGGMAGCAVSHGAAIGLDIEPLTRRAQWKKVVKRWFSPQEQAWLLSADDTEAFLKVWTLKEAWLKATGRGIAGNLQTLTVTDGFELSGDRPREPWRAALGQSADYLVAVVYQGRHVPGGFAISGQIDITAPGVIPRGIQPVDWTLDRQIQFTP